LTIFKEPVCLPCGHIFCSKCLSDHINTPPNKGMTASCPECRTDFNIFTPELACLPRQYHQFILPSVRRVYLDMSACSVLQAKLEKAEARLKVHKSHEEALAKKSESLTAALNAHRAGEKKAVQNATAMKRQLDDCIEERDEKISDYVARYQQLDQEHQLLQNKYVKTKQRYEQLNERVIALEDEQQQQQESNVKRSGAPITPPREIAPELRAMNPLPKRRVTRRTRSNSPPIQDKREVKRPRLSGTR